MAKTYPSTATFTWAKSTLPLWTNTAGFFVYCSLVLFFGFGLIPNFTPLENWQFNVGGMVLVFLLDWLLNTFYTGYKPQGRIVVMQQKMELVSLKGRVEHSINYQNVKGLRVHDGVQFSLFRFISKHRLVIVEMLFKDGSTMKFEAVKWSVNEKGADIEGMMFSLSE
ncbi:MAG: hypothetical protein A3D31_08975 [Candidatus Fluviicola riflensis]|nr:MAG: hypothetical protein CHH17_13385 [Candidatus Fluviicola riflensis]OGS77143.1 MAG: hypothetical protein A3D31_08975 [Candidatus Fluviicola riflensis]OGS82078.1 MAG: hypothetical protein A2724_17920 [Fluviicola sp. RIFCSPHIGHO2_01_FULL_43_53]OGS87772.1 MAG: hypothetical protein A3E30_15355 [Fluviicola sp. RIFCSPHIGHO2_12_FULL_43_24]